MIGRIFFPFLLFAVALTYGFAAQKFPSMGLQEGFGPGLFPTIIASVICIFTLIEGIRQIFAFISRQPGVSINWGVTSREFFNSVIVVLCVVAAVIAMPYFGFVAASTALVFVLSMVMGLRPIWKSVAISFLIAGGLFLVFSEGFGVVFAF